MFSSKILFYQKVKKDINFLKNLLRLEGGCFCDATLTTHQFRFIQIITEQFASQTTPREIFIHRDDRPTQQTFQSWIYQYPNLHIKAFMFNLLFAEHYNLCFLVNYNDM